MKKQILAILLTCAISFISLSPANSQTAEDMINNPTLKPKNQALKYVFTIDNNRSFTMYIYGDEVSVAMTPNHLGTVETHKVTGKWTEGDKLILKLSNGAILNVDSDRVIWDKAVYIRQRN